MLRGRLFVIHHVYQMHILAIKFQHHDYAVGYLSLGFESEVSLLMAHSMSWIKWSTTVKSMWDVPGTLRAKFLL